MIGLILSTTIIWLRLFFFAIMPLAFKQSLFLRSQLEGTTIISALGLIKHLKISLLVIVEVN